MNVATLPRDFSGSLLKALKKSLETATVRRVSLMGLLETVRNDLLLG